jgi:hypothetical protein
MAYVPADIWSEEVKKEILARLNARGLRPKCPMCGNLHFSIGDGYFTHPIQNTLQPLAVIGMAIPTVALICTNCGFLSQHAIGVLGLLDRPSAAGEPK